MPTPTASVELARPAKLCGHHDQGLVEQLLLLQIPEQGRDASVQITDEGVLVDLALIVRVPAGAVDEIQILRRPR